MRDSSQARDFRLRPLARLSLCLLLAVLTACSRPTPPPTPPPTSTATAAPIEPRPVVLPRDDAPHPEYTTEWWYYNGRLETGDGRAYSFHYVVFDVRLQGIEPFHIYQMAITDSGSKAFITDQLLARDSLQAPTLEGFRYTSGGWLAEGNGGWDHLRVDAKGAGFDVRLKPGKAPVVHAGSGYLDFGRSAKTYYYSRTRMSATGTVTLGGLSVEVTGTVWFDHQWGNFQPLEGGWDWFALQLEDGRELMLFQLRDAAGAKFLHFGTLVEKDGSVSELGEQDFQAVAVNTWTSPKSGAEYPMGWKIVVPSKGVEVTLRPLVEAAEFDATATTFNYYWEGGVDVTGTHEGHGFVEMVGYAPWRLPGR